MTEDNSTFVNPTEIERIKTTLINQILDEFDSGAIAPEDYSQLLVDLVLKKFRELRINLPDDIRNPLFHDIIDEILGFGILQPFYNDPSVSEIFVNGKDNIFIEKDGQVVPANVHFKSNEDLARFVERNLKRLGITIDPQNPALDVHLPDDSKLSVILPPLAIEYPILSIQKFSPCKLTISDMLNSGTLTVGIAQFLQACVMSRLNILVIGQESSGKTTLLNGIASFIPLDERVISIEETPELNLPQKQLIRLQSRFPRQENQQLTTTTDLIRLALRMQPQRLILGDMKGSEALLLLQAMNTGCSGSMTTLHANSAIDALTRIETMCMMAGMNLPIRTIHEQIVTALDMIIQMSLLKDGSHRITGITEISGMEGENIILSDIFHFEQTGTDGYGKITGSLKSTGIRPLFLSRLEAVGYKLNLDLFGNSSSNFHDEH